MIQQTLIYKSAFGPEKLSGLSRNVRLKSLIKILHIDLFDMAGIKLHIVSKHYVLVVLSFLKRNKKLLHVSKPSTLFY